MIPIPFHHDEAHLQRWPLLSLGLILLFLGAFWGTTRLGAPAEDAARNARVQALSLWAQHPSLDASRLFPLLEGLDKIQAEEIRRTGVSPDQGLMNALPDAIQELLGQGGIALGQSTTPPTPEESASWKEALEKRIAAAEAAHMKRVSVRFGYTPGHSPWFTVLTWPFVDSRWLGLLGTLLLLWLALPPLEDRWGRGPALVLVLSGIAVGPLLLLLLGRQGGEPLVGGSSLVGTLIGACLIRFPKAQVKFLYLSIRFKLTTFRLPAQVVIPIYTFGQGLSWILLLPGASASPYQVHFAGLGLGIAFATAWRLWGETEETRPPAPLSPKPVVVAKAPSRGGAPLLPAHENAPGREASSSPPSVAPWARLSPKGSGEAGEVEHLAEAVRAAQRSGDRKQVARQARPWVLSLMKTGRGEDGARAWKDLLRDVPEGDLPPGPLLAVAKTLEEMGDPDSSLVALKRMVELHRGDPLHPEAQLALARIYASRPFSPEYARCRGLLEEVVRAARLLRQEETALAAEKELGRLASLEPIPANPVRPPASPLISGEMDGASLERNLGSWMDSKKRTTVSSPAPPWSPAMEKRTGIVTEVEEEPVWPVAASPSVPDWSVPPASSASAFPQGPSSTANSVPDGDGDPLAWLSADFDAHTGEDGPSPPLPPPVNSPVPTRISHPPSLPPEPSPPPAERLGGKNPPLPTPLFSPEAPARTSSLPWSLRTLPVQVMDWTPAGLVVRDPSGKIGTIRRESVRHVACAHLLGTPSELPRWVVDLVTHISESRNSVEVRSIRLSAEHLPEGEIDPGDVGGSFSRFLDKVRLMLDDVRWIPPEMEVLGTSAPVFPDITWYEDAILTATEKG